MSKKNLSGPGPYHLVHLDYGQHLGPFTTELDAMLAKQVAGLGWQFAAVMNEVAFDAYLKARK